MNRKRIGLIIFLFFAYIPMVIIFIASKKRNYIVSDLKRIAEDSYGGCKVNISFFLYIFFISKSFRNIFYYRIQHMKLITKVLSFIYGQKCDFEISCRKIGYGFRVHHGHATVIFADEIGDNFTVWQGVTVGRGKSNGILDIPRIGNNVKIFTNSVVFGGINIGDNCTIGTTSVINYDVPPYNKIFQHNFREGNNDYEKK
jgi:serine O-acetyltransferase